MHQKLIQKDLLSHSIHKILIIRLSSLGDILLTTPVIKALKTKYHNVQIDFVLKKEFCDTLRHNPNISQLYFYEKDNAGLLKNDLLKKKYDFVIDLQNNFRSRGLTKGLGCKIYRFKKPTFKKLLLVWLKINLLKDLKAITSRYAEAAEVDIDQHGLELFLPNNVSSQLVGEKKYIGLCPGAKHFTKRWLPEYFVELGNELNKHGFTIVLFGGKSDKELCEMISKQIFGSLNLQNDNQLFQIAADMRMCQLVITNDSGLMHTASAVGVPIAAILGSTVREFGFFSEAEQNLILENNSLFCRPCSHIGRANCPKKHFKCMTDITPQAVLEKLQNFLCRL